MTRGVRRPLTDEDCAALVADYCAGGLGINALRAKYCCGQARVIAVLEAAGVDRLRHPTAAVRKRGVPRRDLVERAGSGLGRQPTADRWGYLAGIFDAEGYLGYASGGGYFRLTIAQNADRGLHEWLQAVLGAGRISGPRLITGRPSSGIAYFHLEAQRQIFEFCRGVLPHVKVKRARVLNVLAAFCEKYGWEW